MIRWSLTLAALLLALPPNFAAAQQRPGAPQLPPRVQARPYVDPALRMLLRPEVRRAVERAPELRRGRERADERRRAQPFGGGIALDRGGASGSARVGVLVRLREPVPAALAALRQAGAEIGTVVGDIATARVPLDGLDRLTAAVELERLEAARVLEAVHDSSLAAIRANEVRRREGSLWFGAAGYGVIVGVYDTGIDYRHEDFRDGTGRTRLLGLWDQTIAGTPPAGYNYGAFCTVASLDSGRCAQQDNNGHGTHVAGTAVGDGSASDQSGNAYRYAGVAPAADLLVVKGGDGSFETPQLIDGINWIFQTAAALGRPAVVNLSLGGQFGPRDGTSLFEQALDNLTGPGKIIVVAAGNDGQNGNAFDGSGQPTERYLFHGMATPGVGTIHEFQIEVPAYGAVSGTCNDYAFIELWYESGDLLDLTVVRPDGSSVTATHGSRMEEAHPKGMILIHNAYAERVEDRPDPQNGHYEALIEISDCGNSGPPESGIWTLRATATTATSGNPFHLWISASQFGQGGFARGVTANFTNSHVVGSPGTARKVVTVGAFASRLCWPTADGTRCYIHKEQPGDIARFSSAGPSRDGRLKPEITAPGIAIISALSRDADPPGTLVAPDGVHWAIAGTSMATPHVTGAVALLLQREPTLIPDSIKAILQRTTAQDEFTQHAYTGEPDGTPNYQWGYGKLDVARSLTDLESLPPATMIVDAGPVPAAASSTSIRGTRLPLLRLHLRTVGEETVRLLSTGLSVSGEDPEASLLLIHDLDGDAVFDSTEPVLAETAAEIRAGAASTIDLLPRGLDVAPSDSASVLIVLELSGKVPNGTTFRATYEPDRIRTVGIRSGANQVQQGVESVAAPPVQTTVLLPGEIFALSENPVRSGHVVFNFRERPRIAGVYSLNGGRIVDLLTRMATDGRVDWDLTNEQGERVAPGVYLVVFDIGGELVRRKLIIVRPAAARKE